MPRLPSRPLLVQIADLKWEQDGELFQVIDTCRGDGLNFVLTVLTPTGDEVGMSLDEVLIAVGTTMTPDEEGNQWFDDKEYWMQMPEEKQLFWKQRAKDLTKMAIGDALGDLPNNHARPGHIDPNYDPACVAEGVRVSQMSELLSGYGEPGTSPTTLRNQLKRLRETGGVRNLPHRRVGSKKPMSAQIETMRADISSFIHFREDKSQTTRANLVRLYKSTHRSDGYLDGLSHAVITKNVEEIGDKMGAFKSAKTRLSKSTQDKKRKGKFRVDAPFQCLQLDATDYDGFAVDQYNKPIGKLHLVTAVDPFHGRVRAFRFVGGDNPFSAATIKQLLWDTVAGNFFGLDALSNPLGSAPMLARDIILIVTDRGPQFNNFSTLGLAAGLRSHIVMAPPGTGNAKGHVESEYGFSALCAQMLPGAKGANVNERGWKPEKGTMLRVDHLTQMVGALLMLRMHTPRADARWLPGYPGLRLSPVQKEEQFFRTNGTLEVDPNPYRALELLEVEQRSIKSGEAFGLNSRRYWAPCINFLSEQTDRIAVYFDRERPHSVIVRDHSGVPTVVPEVGSDGTEPVLSDWLDRDNRELLRGGAVASLDIESLTQSVVDYAQDVAVKPGGAVRKSPSKKETQPQRTGATNELAMLFTEVIDQQNEGF